MGKGRRDRIIRKESAFENSSEIMSFFESARNAISKLSPELLSEVDEDAGTREIKSTDKI